MSSSSGSSAGIFITFEGSDGAGKSTLIQAVARALESTGYSVVVTREPGGTQVAEKIREVILGAEMDPWTELFLYEAARAEHVAKKILPALEDGRVVLCDRYTDSSLAYQGHARGLPWKDVRTLNHVATGGLKPNLTVFLDVDPALGLKHAQEKTRFEAEGVQFQTRVRAGFLKAKREDPKRWLALKARSGTPEQMAEAVIERVGKLRGRQKFLKLKKSKATGKKARG